VRLKGRTETQIFRTVELTSRGGEGPYTAAVIDCGTVIGTGAVRIAPTAVFRVGAAALGDAIAFCGLATIFLQHSWSDGIWPHSPAILLQQARS
jgi:hypothetical protein